MTMTITHRREVKILVGELIPINKRVKARVMKVIDVREEGLVTYTRVYYNLEVAEL